jgi:hypothetical protein
MLSRNCLKYASGQYLNQPRHSEPRHKSERRRWAYGRLSKCGKHQYQNCKLRISSALLAVTRGWRWCVDKVSNDESAQGKIALEFLSGLKEPPGGLPQVVRFKKGAKGRSLSLLLGI